MREPGIVIHVSGAWMDIRMHAGSSEACRKCGACEVVSEGRDMVLRVPAVGDIRPGESVTVELPEASPWTGIVFVLGLPIAALAAGILVGSRWMAWRNLLRVGPDLGGAALGVLVGLLVFGGAMLVDRRFRRRIVVQRTSDAAGHGA